MCLEKQKGERTHEAWPPSQQAPPRSEAHGFLSGSLGFDKHVVSHSMSKSSILTEVKKDGKWGLF